MSEDTVTSSAPPVITSSLSEDDSITSSSSENTPEQNALIARLRATLPACIAKHDNPEGSMMVAE